jgi:hypothetical protein
MRLRPSLGLLAPDLGIDKDVAGLAHQCPMAPAHSSAAKPHEAPLLCRELGHPGPAAARAHLGRGCRQNSPQSGGPQSRQAPGMDPLGIAFCPLGLISAGQGFVDNEDGLEANDVGYPQHRAHGELLRAGGAEVLGCRALPEPRKFIDYSERGPHKCRSSPQLLDELVIISKNVEQRPDDVAVDRYRLAGVEVIRHCRPVCRGSRCRQYARRTASAMCGAKYRNLSGEQVGFEGHRELEAKTAR